MQDSEFSEIIAEYEKKREEREKKKRIGVMDIILIFIAVVLIWFTAIMIYLFDKHEAIPDTLCTCVFAALVGECGAMAWIKTTKDRYRERDYELEDRKSDKKEE